MSSARWADARSVTATSSGVDTLYRSMLRWQAEWRLDADIANVTAAYAGAWLLLGKAMADAGLALQTGALGWTAVFRGHRPVYPPMPRRGRLMMRRIAISSAGFATATR